MKSKMKGSLNITPILSPKNESISESIIKMTSEFNLDRIEDEF